MNIQKSFFAYTLVQSGSIYVKPMIIWPCTYFLVFAFSLQRQIFKSTILQYFWNFI